ncbi:MAG: formate/nitrite transporter family protein [Clostridia bacterium]|nr:formate/nitrite transporter family protein [Clostridia bacterium]
MKDFERMSRKDFIIFCLMGIFAGIVIGIGGGAFLYSLEIFPDGWGRLVGGFLFALGMYAIISFHMRLFTGMIGEIPVMGVKNMWRLPLCLLCNTLGVFFAAGIIKYSPIADVIIPRAASLIEGKLTAENWGWNAVCSGTLCGILINVSVWSAKQAPRRGLSASFGVVLPIIVFAFCGFDHSVANMLYFYYLGELSWRVVGYALLAVLGNIIGGVMLPFIVFFRDWHRANDASSK